jgi:hypothetical protein
MWGLDIFTPCQVRDHTRKFQDAMIGSRRQIELSHRRAYQMLTIVLQLAKLPYLSDAHIGIANDVE